MCINSSTIIFFHEIKERRRRMVKRREVEYRNKRLHAVKQWTMTTTMNKNKWNEWHVCDVHEKLYF